MRQPSVVIIGAGMTGILLCIKLKAAGINDITIIEKKDRVGGTWRENTYPGVACDIPAHFYSYSFEPNPDFSNQFARGPELQNYFTQTSEKYGVNDNIRFNEEVTEAVYREGQWQITTDHGKALQADFLISATGILHHPKLPEIDGMETFKGATFHTAQWNHDIDLKGKKVAYIGTGSTACQAIPELINCGVDIEVFQRTPQWILPMADHLYGDKLKAAKRRHPWIMTLYRTANILFMEQFAKGIAGHKLQHGLINFICRRNLKRSIKDPILREKLTPDYTVGCKRLVINNTFYEAIQKPNATLTTDPIKAINEEGVVTADGAVHEADIIIYSTGFDAFKFMRPMNLIGKNNTDINSVWEQKVQAYQSLLLPNFPNFFLMLGPHTPIGNFSVTMMSEVQADYLIQLIDLWRQEKLASVEAKQSAMEDFNRYLKQGFGKTAWLGGCQSWYLDADGDPIAWPYTWRQWVARMKEPRLQDFVTVDSSDTTSQTA